MMSPSLDFLWDFLKPVLSGTLTEALPPSPEAKARKDLLALHASLQGIEEKTALFVAAIGDIVGFEREKLVSEGRERLAEARKYASELLRLLLELAEILDRIAPKLSVYKHELIREINQYRSSRALVISKLEEEIYKIEYGDYSGTVINELYLRSLENLTRITKASAEVRGFIATQFGFKELYE